MMQNLGFHSSHTVVVEKEPLRRSQKHVPVIFITGTQSTTSIAIDLMVIQRQER